MHFNHLQSTREGKNIFSRLWHVVSLLEFILTLLINLQQHSTAISAINLCFNEATSKISPTLIALEDRKGVCSVSTWLREQEQSHQLGVWVASHNLPACAHISARGAWNEGGLTVTLLLQCLSALDVAGSDGDTPSSPGTWTDGEMENWNGGKGWSDDRSWFGWKKSPFIIQRRVEKQFVRVRLASNSMPHLVWSIIVGYWSVTMWKLCVKCKHSRTAALIAWYL